ncbi:DEAD/DEAH box helicase [Caulobacter sp. SLTY]|uniref:DEAD/DEAH box helicase n=1 Tax=Caulobacter sp. SLTY TaxID=2683262 RepID=UPI001411F9BD|nr:DEAD/DEAH box helicase [Caulobacter sp. SLTY]NBB14983.1 DEAD/DEAH box helicase [Caulobacter sp. SLTY]
MTAFTDLGLCKPILSALLAEGYTTPTPIQAQAIPLVLEGRDILGIAQTGTGKTAAFALPILQRLAEDRKPAPRRGCRALVLSPTRELATQIAESFRAYGKNMGLTVAVVFGGVKYGPQVRALAAGVDVLVATPGRLIDHINEKVANLSETEVFVLDEADQMLDMGFVVPIRRIAKTLPQQRQNLFFSATMPTEIGKLAGELLKNPAKVSVTPQATTVEKIDQKILFIESGRKRALLAELMDDGAMKRVLIFTRTKRGADRVAKQLGTIGVEAAAIHGDKSQGQRERSLASFKAGDVRALVATDIAARGIDVDGVSHVIQYELPNVPEAYVHRIGRTARAGANGSAISLVADDERNLLKDIQKVTRQTIPSWDRRNDRNLGSAEAAFKAAQPAEVARERDPRDTRGRSPAAKRHEHSAGKHFANAPRASRPGGYDPMVEGATAAPAANAAAKPKKRRRFRPGGGRGPNTTARAQA